MDDRKSMIYRLLADYVRSPSLRHLRDDRSLQKIANEIVQNLDQRSAVWKKWEGKRDAVLKSALECWIPKAELLSFLNGLPGPRLTMTVT